MSFITLPVQQTQGGHKNAQFLTTFSKFVFLTLSLWAVIEKPLWSVRCQCVLLLLLLLLLSRLFI